MNFYLKSDGDASNETVKLTKNEQKVLKEILLKEKISDTSIAGSIKISQQAVNQIRTRLETLGVIKGYTPMIDFNKIGIHIVSLVGIRVKHEIWEKKKEWEIEESLKKIPFIFQAYRIVGHDLTHMLMLGFSDSSQRDRFIRKLETLFTNEVEVKWNYSIAVKDIIMQDPLRLLNSIIDKEEYEFESLFL
jgi:DNA-binding Lrp family transcriptional regulator